MAEHEDHGDSHGDVASSSNTANHRSAITYTSQRKTTTKTAASSTRRRHNISLCRSGANHTSGDSWFSRKAAGWTDDEIRSHLVSGGTSSKGGGSLSMEGDLIQGGGGDRDGRRNKKRSKRRRLGGPRFAWEEEDDEDADNKGDDNDQELHVEQKSKFTMRRAAPTLQDIMDEQDQIDLLAPQTVGKDFQSSGGNSGNRISSTTVHPNRHTNAALAEIAQLYNDETASGDRAVIPAPNSLATDSIGWRLLRLLGYRSRLGMAFVPLAGDTFSGKEDYANNLDLMQGTTNLSTKFLASKGLRAIRLPSIAQNTTSSEATNETYSRGTSNQVLVLPQPKLNKHGIGYDPFKDAPEFRAFHEQRQALAQKRGRAADKKELRSTAYFTDNLRRDERQRLWDKNRDDNDDDDDNVGTNEASQRKSNPEDNTQHMNYAARDYFDFIGTKASSGFALEDEDDTNIYQDDDDDGGFPKISNKHHGMGSTYNLEIHSPVTSENEDDDNHNGLFNNSVAVSRQLKSSGARKSEEGDRNVADAWDAWGIGEGESTSRSVTSDGKPPLRGFQLGQQMNIQAKRWEGPMLPSGFVLKRQVFPATKGVETAAKYKVNVPDLDRPPRSTVPKVLPHSEPTKNGAGLNFDAVKESMKNRFVSSSGNGKNDVSINLDYGDILCENGGQDMKDKEEWIDVTIASWMPSRLLCKRWGVPLPSTLGVVASTQVSTTGRVYIGEEEAFFNETVLPKGCDDRGGGNFMRMKSQNRNDDSYLIETVDEEIIGPPPTRPSEFLFKSIFDVTISDMDISSSEDEDQDTKDGAKEPSSSGREDAKHNAASRPETFGDVHSGSSFSESEDSHRQTRKHRHLHNRKKSHRKRSPSTSYEYNSSDDYGKRRKRKKKRHKRSSSVKAKRKKKT